MHVAGTSGMEAALDLVLKWSVRDAAVEQSDAAGTRARLHVADGGLLGMNGNYAAGILEGVAHFHPEAVAWLARTT